MHIINNCYFSIIHNKIQLVQSILPVYIKFAFDNPTFNNPAHSVIRHYYVTTQMYSVYQQWLYAFLYANFVLMTCWLKILILPPPPVIGCRLSPMTLLCIINLTLLRNTADIFDLGITVGYCSVYISSYTLCVSSIFGN